MTKCLQTYIKTLWGPPKKYSNDGAQGKMAPLPAPLNGPGHPCPRANPVGDARRVRLFRRDFYEICFRPV
jgi:hypothetical protein